jgi:anti-sigma B factor antagonist
MTLHAHRAVPQPGPYPTPLTADTSWRGRRAVIAVAGEIDIAGKPVLDRALDAAIEAGALELWVDLGEVTFIDSTGLHLMLALQRRLQALNRRLALIVPGGPVHRLVGLAGLEGVLPLHASRQEAHAAFD